MNGTSPQKKINVSDLDSQKNVVVVENVKLRKNDYLATSEINDKTIFSFECSNNAFPQYFGEAYLDIFNR